MKLVIRFSISRLFRLEKGDKPPATMGRFCGVDPGRCTEFVGHTGKFNRLGFVLNGPQVQGSNRICGRPGKYKIECNDGCYEYSCGYHVRSYLNSKLKGTTA